MLSCGGSIHLSPLWGLGVGRFDAFLYTCRPDGALRLVVPCLLYTYRPAGAWGLLGLTCFYTPVAPMGL